MPRAIITLVLLLVSLVGARADLRIVSSGGGEVVSYLRLFAAIRQSGQRVIIDGSCLSPAGVRAWIQCNGGLTQKMIFLRGRQLAALYARCQ